MNYSFNKRPLKVFFEGKLHNEHIYHIFHKHPITDIPEWTVFMLLYIFPLMWIIQYSVSGGTIAFWVLIVLSFYFAFLATALFISWTNDIFDLFILTDKRLIDITQGGFLKRKNSIAELHQIQNASFTQQGALDHILNVGVVDVQTAGSNADLTMEFIQHPAKVTDLILRFAREYTSQREVEITAQAQSAAPSVE